MRNPVREFFSDPGTGIDQRHAFVPHRVVVIDDPRQDAQVRFFRGAFHRM